MKNQLTFAHVTGALLDNKIKTYPQHRLVRDLFSLCLWDEASDYSEASDDNITFSRWCNGARPVPVDILSSFEGWNESFLAVVRKKHIHFSFDKLADKCF